MHATAPLPPESTRNRQQVAVSTHKTGKSFTLLCPHHKKKKSNFLKTSRPCDVHSPNFLRVEVTPSSPVFASGRQGVCPLGTSSPSCAQSPGRVRPSPPSNIAANLSMRSYSPQLRCRLSRRAAAGLPNHRRLSLRRLPPYRPTDGRHIIDN